MYRVHLQDFEGPLDLLLFFIQRDELDIYDIPIARIADEFLSYVRVLEQIDLDGVGDFIYMAAVLINIKARTLLPSSETDDDGEPVDPRRELVERLLEYVRYREAAESLSVQHERRAERYVRGAASSERTDLEEEAHEVPLDASVFDLVRALRHILTEAPAEPVHAVKPISYSVEAQQAYVMAALTAHAQRSFIELVRGRTKPFVIATFLAVLELARQGTLRIVVDDALQAFSVRRPDAAEEAVDAA